MDIQMSCVPRWDLAARGLGSCDFYSLEFCEGFSLAFIVGLDSMLTHPHWLIGCITNSWLFYSKVQFVNFDEVIRIIIVQNILRSFNPGPCRSPPPALWTYWVLTCYTDSYLYLLPGPSILNSPRTPHTSKWSPHDWIKILTRKLQHTALHSHLE